MLRGAIVTVSGFLILGSTAMGGTTELRPGPTLSVSPLEGPLSAPLEIKVSGVKPGARVTLTAERIALNGEVWTSSAVLVADRRGDANTAESPSVGGSYVGLSPHGLFCSVLPVSFDKLPSYVSAFPGNPAQPSTIATSLETAPFVVKASVDGRLVGTTTVWRGFAVGTRGEDIRDRQGLRGVYFAPAPGVRMGEPVVVLTGSGGGVFLTTAALLASNGHPTLALALYNYDDLPKALHQVPLESVRDGVRWLARKSGTRRAAVLGISRGSEAAQLAAAYFPDDFSGVIAQVPSHLVGGALGPGTTSRDAAWSVGGEPIPPFSGPDFDSARLAEAARVPPGYQGSADLLLTWNSQATEAKAGIPYDNIKAPLLILAAGSDAMWPSNVSAERIRRRMATLGRSGQVEIHTYRDAGHSLVYVGRGNALSYFGYSSALRGYIATGGTPTGNCEASFQAFDQTLKFLRRLRS